MLHGAADDYLRELEGAFRNRLDGLKVVLDCANGSTHFAGPEIFKRLGAETEVMCADPDGRNINEGCGSTHPESLAERVIASGADIGFAFDGDGDRVVAVDASGEVRDGDELIVLAASHLAEAGELGGGVAVTVMSNFGFHDGDEGGRDRGGDDPRRRSARLRGTSRARLDARRRAVGSHHLDRLRADGRRHRGGSA